MRTSIKRALCFESLQAIDYFNHLESGILIYTKASLVVSTVPASTSKKTATLPRTKEWSLKGETSLFSLSDPERHTKAEDRGKDGLVATLKRSQQPSSLGE